MATTDNEVTASAAGGDRQVVGQAEGSTGPVIQEVRDSTQGQSGNESSQPLQQLPPGPATSIPSSDWSQVANNVNLGGMLSTVQGASRDALMKQVSLSLSIGVSISPLTHQLQALQSSHAAAARHRMSGSGNGTAPSPDKPASISEINPALTPTNLSQNQILPTVGINGPIAQTPYKAPTPNPTPTPPIQSGISTTQVPPVPQAPTTNAIVNPNPTSLPQARPPRASLQDQRKHFLVSLASFYKQNNIEPPVEIFNGEREGSIKLGETWVEVVELFLMAMRHGGIGVVGSFWLLRVRVQSLTMKVAKLPADTPPWSTLLTSRNIPNPLPEPLPLPRMPNTEPSAPPTYTTNAVHYLITAHYAWLQAFEQHMQRSKAAMAQRQAALQGKAAGPGGVNPSTQAPGVSGATPQAAAAPSPAQSQSITAPSPAATLSAPSPAGQAISQPSPAQPMTAPSPASLNMAAPSPAPSSALPVTQPSSLPSPAPPPGSAPATPAFPDPAHQHRPAESGGPIPTQMGFIPASTAPTSAEALVQNIKPDNTASQPPIGSGSANPSAAPPTHFTNPPSSSSVPQPMSATTPAEPHKRKKRKTQATPPRQITPPPPPPRARYKVEYKPLHLPLSSLNGWDERAVSSTFPKNNLNQPSRSIHDLGVVDMEAVLMGLRCRMPQEISYALIVLSMLSMAHPEENIAGLPLMHLGEIYLEVLELASDAVFPDGYEAWASAAGEEKDFSYTELEQLGLETDFEAQSTAREIETLHTCLNLLRNFSMMPENIPLMASFPALFDLLARVSDARLYPKLYSIHDLARTRRDCVSIISNIGMAIDLRNMSPHSTARAVRLIASFLPSGPRESLYGPTPPVREEPPATLHSVNRAVEALCKLTFSDSNREVLSKLPTADLVALFTSLLRFLPVHSRDFDALRNLEEYLCQAETIALSLYSLAFLSPLSTRSTFRSIPGTSTILTRVIHTCCSIAPSQGQAPTQGMDFKHNPYNVLCRRLAETLGVLNGTAGIGIDSFTHMSFSAGGAAQGWGGSKSADVIASRAAERGWLAHHEEWVMESMGVRGMDVPAFVELDGLWWAGD